MSTGHKQISRRLKSNIVRNLTSGGEGGWHISKTGSPPMREMKHILEWWQLAKCTPVNSFTFRKVSAKICNFRVPVYKGVPLPWMKWHPSFNDGGLPSVRLWKVSLAEKWVLKYATLGFLFIRGFPSHEWNETHPLTMTGCQLHYCENLRFLKSES